MSPKKGGFKYSFFIPDLFLFWVLFLCMLNEHIAKLWALKLKESMIWKPISNVTHRVVKTTLKNKLNFVLFTMVELDLRLICQHKWQNHIFDLFAPKCTFAAGKNDTHRFSDRFNVWWMHVWLTSTTTRMTRMRIEPLKCMAWLSESEMTNEILTECNDGNKMVLQRHRPVWSIFPSNN